MRNGTESIKQSLPTIYERQTKALHSIGWIQCINWLCRYTDVAVKAFAPTPPVLLQWYYLLPTALGTICLWPVGVSSELRQWSVGQGRGGRWRNAGTVSSCFPEFDREFLNNSEAVSLRMRWWWSCSWNDLGLGGMTGQGTGTACLCLPSYECMWELVCESVCEGVCECEWVSVCVVGRVSTVMKSSCNQNDVSTRLSLPV